MSLFVIFAMMSTISLHSVLALPATKPISYKCETKNFCSYKIGRDSKKMFNCRDEHITCCPAPNNQFTLVKLQPNQECCVGSGEIINTLTHICVGGKAKEREEFEDNCGPNKSYNTKTQVCCRGSNYLIFNVYDYVPGGECCDEHYSTNPNKRCCGGKPYLKSEKTCCSLDSTFTFHPVPFGKCCGGTRAYNPDVNDCVDDEVVPKRIEHLSICAEGVTYDETVSGCCMGPLPNKLFNLETQLCVNGIIFEKNNIKDDSVCFRNRRRTEGMTYKESSEMVCHNGVVQRLTEDQQACGDKIINKHTDLCCSSTDAYLNVGPGMKCCESGSNIYDPTRQSCCMNQVNNEVSEISAPLCCHKTPYNNSTHHCPNGRKLVKKERVDEGLSLEEHCSLTEAKLQEIKNQFSTKKGKGIYAYLVSAESEDTSTGKNEIRWFISNVKQIKGKRTLKLYDAAKGKLGLEGKPSSCLKQIQEGEQYLIITGNKFARNRRAKLFKKVLKMTSDSSAYSFIVPLNNINALGNFFSNIMKHS